VHSRELVRSLYLVNEKFVIENVIFEDIDAGVYLFFTKLFGSINKIKI